MVVVAIAGLMALPAFAQSSNYAAALRRMIGDTTAGSCPPDIMGSELLAGCQEQLAQMSAGLASLGAVESARLLRTEDRPHGKVEIHEVKFANGITLNWGIGGHRDGKFKIAYAGGE